MTFPHHIVFSTLFCKDGDSILSKRISTYFEVISTNISVFNNKVCMGTSEGKSYFLLSFLHLEKIDNLGIDLFASSNETIKCMYHTIYQTCKKNYTFEKDKVFLINIVLDLAKACRRKYR